jgi:hypothetical protein
MNLRKSILVLVAVLCACMLLSCRINGTAWQSTFYKSLSLDELLEASQSGITLLHQKPSGGFGSGPDSSSKEQTVLGHLPGGTDFAFMNKMQSIVAGRITQMGGKVLGQGEGTVQDTQASFDVEYETGTVRGFLHVVATRVKQPMSDIVITSALFESPR